MLSTASTETLPAAATAANPDMAPWFVVGTPYARWGALARALQPANGRLVRWPDGLGATVSESAAEPLSLDGAQAGDAGEHGVWLLDRLASHGAVPRLLVFVDHPAAAIASWLAEHPGADPEAAVRAWCVTAQRLLRHAHKHPARTLVVETEESARAPAGLVRAVSTRLGVTVGRCDGLPALEANDPLLLALGSGVVRDSRQTQSLYEQLRASCVPLATDELPDTRIDHAAASAAVGRLRQEIATLRDELASAHATASRQSEALAAETVRLGAATNEATALRAGLASTERENRTLQAALDSSQSQLSASRHAEVEAARSMALLTSDRDATRIQRDLLVRQLFAVREELEQYYVARHAERVPTATQGVDEVLVGAVQIGSAGSDPPHHHLDFELRQVQSAHRQLERLSVRLVEHRGRAGLVLLSAAGEPRPLAAWESTGQEHGLDLMELLPSDDPARRRFERLATGDWVLVVGLVSALKSALGGTDAVSLRWRRVATRLARELAQMPPRLRYSRIRVDMPATGSDIEIEFQDVMFGSQRLHDLALRWRRSNSAGTPLVLLAPNGEDALPPLSSWPTQEDGTPAPALPLPVDANSSAADKRRFWLGLPPSDRELVLALLDALPAVAGPAAEGKLPSEAVRGALVDDARRLYRDARRSLRQLTVRSTLRAVARRLQRR